MQIRSIVGSLVFAFCFSGTLFAQNPQESPAPDPPKPLVAASAAPAPSTQGGARPTAPTRVAPGSKLFLSAMPGNLEGFISAEIIKRKLPLSLTTDENAAEYILLGTSLKGDDKWYHVVFGGKDKNEGNVTLVNVKEKTVVWAGEAGDRSMWWGGFKRGGERKVADRIVSKMKKDLFR